MTNGYFNHDNPESKRTLARAESINATLEAVAAGFDLLPDELPLKQGRVTWATATGGPAAYVVTLPFTPPTYALGLNFRFKVPATNTGASSINVMGPTGPLGAKALKRFDGADTLPSDLVSGSVADVAYDGSQFVIVGVHGSSEVNAAASAAAAAVSATTAGGAAPAGRMTWDAGTSTSDPGAGAIRANSGTTASITAVHISETDADGASLSQVFAAWAASTNPVKGRLRIGARTALSKWIEADVSAVVDNGSWWTLTLANPTGPGGFAAGEIVAVGFARSGDRGVVSAYWGGSAGGTANALTATTGASLSGMERGQIIGIRTGAAVNSGAATLALDAVPVTAIQKNGAALVGGELPTNTNMLFQYDGSALQIISGGASGAFASVAGKAIDYSILPADGGGVIKATSAIILTLPAASAVQSGWWVTLSNRSTGTVQIARTGSDTISGLAGGFVLRSYEDITLYRSSSSGYDVLNLGRSVTEGQGAWNPAAKGGDITLSNSNLTATSGGTLNHSVRATVGASTGKRYFEMVANSASGAVVGLMNASGNVNSWFPQDANGWGYFYDGSVGSGGSVGAYGSSLSNGSVVRVAVDLDAGKLFFGVGSVWQGSSDPVTGTSPAFAGVLGTLYPAFGRFNTGIPSGTIILNFSSFVYAPPTGYTTFY